MILLSIVTFQVINLIRYVNRTNQELSRFLDSVRDNDFTAGIGKIQSDPSFNNLHNSFKSLMMTLGSFETEKEIQNRFLITLIDLVPIGFLVIRKNHSIELMNAQAAKMLDLPPISDWRKLKSNSTLKIKHLLGLGYTLKNSLVEFAQGDTKLIYSVNATPFVLADKHYTIYTLKNIDQEIQIKESEAWQKLMRILTHEMMNSLTPLISLTETVKDMLTKPTIDAELQQDIIEAIDTIYNRNSSLLSFIKTYKQFAKLPPPQRASEPVLEVVQSVLRLIRMDKRISAIELNSNLQLTADQMMYLDRAQFEQVLINLLKNGFEATHHSNTPVVSIRAQLTDVELVIDITDNGPGVDTDKINRIFIPFFTTKEKGSGVGLSLSRQIIIAHGGQLSYQRKDELTNFQIRIPNTTLS